MPSSVLLYCLSFKYCVFQRASSSEQQSSWLPNFPPVSVNAVYTYWRNEILFPVGFLQPPFFSKDQPMALNFGQLGASIGHEVNSYAAEKN